MIHADNERILTLMSEYLCFTPGAIAPPEVHARARETGLPLNDAYLSLLMARLGLDPADPADARLCQAYLPQMVREHTPDTYLNDAYMQAMRPAVDAAGRIELAEEALQPMELFIADDFRVDGAGRILPQLGWFRETFHFPALREDGVVWMTVTPNEINTIRPAVARSRGKVLTYGLGLGYYAFHALLQPEVSSVTVVERSPQVIEVFRRHLLPFFPGGKPLIIRQADAFDYAARTAPHEGYDTVFADLWRDVADGLPLYRRMKALETPGPTYLYWMESTLRCYTD